MFEEERYAELNDCLEQFEKSKNTKSYRELQSSIVAKIRNRHERITGNIAMIN